MLIPDAKAKLMMTDVHSHYYPKTLPHGDDAHFICREKQVIGVADGVGGWSLHGIDAGEYSRELMKYAKYSVNNSQPAADVDPMSVLFDAFKKTKKEGSSTACIIALNGGRLRAANVGDSGFLVIRGGKTIYRSPVQQHEFNTPYQLGNDSGSNRPSDAVEIEVAVESGDIIVAGTDGLFDNVFPEEIEATVERCSEDEMPLEMAQKLAKVACRNSQKSNTNSPFSMAAKQAGRHRIGGKIDDITVVVARVILVCNY